MLSEQEIINKLTAWADRRQDVRAIILTSSRTNPNATIDDFSDFDIILAVEDIQPYLDNDRWLEDFGKVLVVYRDPIKSEYGFSKFCRVTQYEDGLKIDFTLWPEGLLKYVARMETLPDYIDDGYQVMLDKDNLTQGIKAPSYKAFIPKPPIEIEYLTFIEEFFSNAPYVAKHIQRGDFFPLKLMLNYMRYEKLRKMLEWKVEIEHDWSLRLGNYGKGLHKYLSLEILKELENTCVTSRPDADWDALFKIIALFGKVAREVGKSIGHIYPEELDRRVVEYCREVRDRKIG